MREEERLKYRRCDVVAGEGRIEGEEVQEGEGGRGGSAAESVREGEEDGGERVSSRNGE